MSEPKPLHVRVAEALGWNKGKPLKASIAYPGHWYIDGECSHTGFTGLVPRYDTSWEATGPLIERYGIELGQLWPGDWGGDGFRWYAITAGDSRVRNSAGVAVHVEGSTPLIAVCNLLLALSEAGKLPKENR